MEKDNISNDPGSPYRELPWGQTQQGAPQSRTESGHKENPIFWIKIELKTKHLGDLSLSLGTDHAFYHLQVEVKTI